MKLKTKIFSLFMAGYFFAMSGFIGLANATWELKDYVTYMGYTNEAITVVWDASINTDRYDVRLLHVEKNVYIDKGSTVQETMDIYLPKSGHFIVEIRSANALIEGNWCQSTDITYATVNGNPAAWWIYGHVAPVGPITIGKNTYYEGEINYGS